MFETAYAATEEAAKEGIAIHVAPQILGHIGSFPVTNTLLTAWVAVAVLIVVAFFFRKSYRVMPSRAQVAVESLVGGVYDYVETTLGNKEVARKAFPVIMTIFIMVLALNWVGLLPGVSSIGIYSEHGGHQTLVPFLYPAHTDLNNTFALAVIAFFSIEILGIITVGFFRYIGKFFVLWPPQNLFIGLIELFGEFIRLLTFSFRLFGNIFAGKVLLLIAIWAQSFLLPVPVLAFEVFVGLLQAAIFALLTLLFIKLAIAEPHGGSHAKAAHNH